MRVLLAGIATAALACGAGCGSKGPVQGSLLVASGAGDTALSPDEAQAAAAIIGERLRVAQVTGATVQVYDGVKIEVFVPTIDPVVLGDWRLLVTTPGRLEFRAEERDADAGEWLAERGRSKQMLVAPDEPPGLNGAVVASAEAVTNESGSHQVIMHFKPSAEAAITAATKALAGRRLAIVMDGEVLIAPMLQGALGSSAVIDPGAASGFSKHEALRLAALMSTDPLPAPVEIDGATPVKR